MFVELRQAVQNRLEGRRWQRHHVKVRVSLRLNRNGIEHFLNGTCYDLSEGGTRLFLTSELHPGEEVWMKLTLPYSPPVEVRGVVRNQMRFEYGIEFLEASETDRQNIARNCKAISLTV
jgi:hypothetical protein